ncbi:3-deoxy-7-phosphoheptulonate synthase [Streptomyces sp. NBC_00388]|uniref:3-deoxy-7-phosphoheptulonate synthase n=1 Tax=Streptomyces sp. NBC_00388 TaxID=2975735 RepID=UPI002E1DA9D9
MFERTTQAVGGRVVSDEVLPDAVGGRHRSHTASTPGELRSELPRTPDAAAAVDAGRRTTRQVLRGKDDRLLVVVGPCSIHDVDAGREYATSLNTVAAELRHDLAIVMRVYVEKPRTTVGWTGLLADPHLDGRLDFDRGLRATRKLMLDIAESGMPIATEWLSPAAPAYLADLISWGAIGARTVESQVHRQLASGLPMPVGMKNGSTGSVKVAVDAITSAAAPHGYLGFDQDGRAVTLHTSGNPDCHVVLRGGAGRPNYQVEHVDEAAGLLASASLPAGVVIDASHANSDKNHERQATVAGEIGEQVARGSTDIRGVMLEGFILPGRQDLGPEEPAFGQSITDACMGWETTVDVLTDLAAASRARRAATRA